MLCNTDIQAILVSIMSMRIFENISFPDLSDPEVQYVVAGNVGIIRTTEHIVQIVQEKRGLSEAISHEIQAVQVIDRKKRLATRQILFAQNAARMTLARALDPLDSEMRSPSVRNYCFNVDLLKPAGLLAIAYRDQNPDFQPIFEACNFDRLMPDIEDAAELEASNTIATLAFGFREADDFVPDLIKTSGLRVESWVRDYDV